MPHEVLTLQLGSFANYVGTHYWNFQDELLGLQEREDAVGAAAAQIDSGVLYRAGETARGQPTFTPRLVAWDLSGALGGASSRGSLYLEEGHLTAAGTWAGRHEVHRALPVARSAFSCALEQEPEGPPPPQAGNVMATAAGVAAAEALAAAARALDGEGAVRYWTDYLKAHLHPRSLHQLPGVWEGGAPFDGWGDGAAYAASAERREGMLEAVRFFAEEADSLQGLQLFVDDLSGFGAIAARLLPELREDLGPSLPVLLYAVRPSAAEPPGLELAALRRRRLGEALSLARLSQHASVATVVAPPATPTALPLLRWLPERPFHTSALCAAALDTATLPYRLAPGDGSPVGIGAREGSAAGSKRSCAGGRWGSSYAPWAGAPS